MQTEGLVELLPRFTMKLIPDSTVLITAPLILSSGLLTNPVEVYFYSSSLYYVMLLWDCFPVISSVLGGNYGCSLRAFFHFGLIDKPKLEKETISVM